MKSSMKNYIFDDSLLFSIEHFKDALNYSHAMSLGVLDLESLAMETGRAGEKAMVGNCLSPIEQQRFDTLSYGKRKNEWLGGRVSAKIAAARCMAASDTSGATLILPESSSALAKCKRARSVPPPCRGERPPW